MTSTTTSRPWMPFAMAAGTTAFIIVPLFWIRRQRGHALGQALAPTTAASAIRFARGSPSPVVVVVNTTTTTTTTRPQPSSTPPGLFTALSHADMSSSLYAAKALGIATALVAVTGFGLVSTIKAVTGLKDMDEFAQQARRGVQTYIPSLSKAIYRLPDTPTESADPALQRIALQLDNELIQEIKRLNT